MTCSTPERSEGLALLNEGCKVVEEKIKAAGGNFAIQMAPKVVTATDEDELAARIRRAEEENAEGDVSNGSELRVFIQRYCTLLSTWVFPKQISVGIPFAVHFQFLNTGLNSLFCSLS